MLNEGEGHNQNIITVHIIVIMIVIKGIRSQEYYYGDDDDDDVIYDAMHADERP